MGSHPGLRQAPAWPSQGARRQIRWVWICIYCGATPADGLQEEHIIPKALRSHLAIREASCARCEAITHAFEGRALSSVFLHPRLHSNMKRTEPKRIPITLTKSGIDYKEAVRPEDYHVFGHFPVFLPARTILGIPPEPTGWSFVRVAVIEDMDRAKTSPLFGQEFRESYMMHLADFSRMAAKVCYCFAVASCGMDAFDTRITDYILGRIIINPDFYVGTDQDGVGVKEEGVLHQMGMRYANVGGRGAFVATVQFFAWIGGPVYHVSLGTATHAGLFDMP